MKKYLFTIMLIVFILIPASISFADKTNLSDVQTILGGEEYATIQNNIITLNQDVTLTSEINIKQLSVTLDLNGYKIKNETSSVHPMFNITNSNFTIKDSSVAKSGGLIDISSSIPELITLNSGSLHIEDGNFISNEKGIYATGGKLIIDNGTFITNNRCVLTSDISTLYINNGSFTSNKSNALDISGTTSIINAGTFKGNFSGLEASHGTIHINSGSFTGDRGVVITGGNMTIKSGNYIGDSKSLESNGLYINGGNLHIKSGTFKGSAAGLFIDKNATVAISGGTFKCTKNAPNTFGGIALYQGAKANIASINGMKYNRINRKKNILSLLTKGYSLNNNTLEQKEVDLFELTEMGANGITLQEGEYYIGYYSISKPYIKVIKSSINNTTSTSNSNSDNRLDNTPKTGDNITLYITSLVLSLIGLYIIAKFI